MTFQLHKLCGIQPDRLDTHRRFQAERVRTFGADTSGDLILQPANWIRNQQFNPSCGGQSFASGVDAWTGAPKPTVSSVEYAQLVQMRMIVASASAIGIWKEARRRQGDLLNVNSGIALEFAIESLEQFGWRVYVPGEDGLEYLQEDKREDGLEEQLFGADHRSEGLRHFVPPDGDLDALDTALADPSTAVVFGTGVRAGYDELQNTPGGQDIIVDDRLLGGGSNGHAQRLRGRWRRSDGIRLYLVVNSWGDNWGGCHLPDGTFLPGCVWITESVIRNAWDMHGLVIRA